MASINKVIIIGNLGNDPDLKHTPAGKAVANVSVATNKSWKNDAGVEQNAVEWHRIVVWGKTAENVARYLKKGSPAYFEGEIQTRKWEDKDGKTNYTTEIHAHVVQFLSSTNTSSGARPPHPADAQGGNDDGPL